jgi:hypothetical protein
MKRHLNPFVQKADQPRNDRGEWVSTRGVGVSKGPAHIPLLLTGSWNLQKGCAPGRKHKKVR